MDRFGRWALGALGAVSSAVAVAGVTRDDVAPAFHVAESLQPAFSATGLATRPGLISGAVLIADGFALSAGHVADVNPTQVSFADQVFDITATHIHPTWNGDPLNQVDLAIFELSGSPVLIDPATLFTDPTISTLVGQEVGFVGSGETGNGVTGSIAGSSGTRLGGTNIVEFTDSRFGNVTAPVLFTDFDDPDPFDHLLSSSDNDVFAPTDLEIQLGTGDSGSGVFASDGSLVGIASFVSGNNNQFGALSGFAAVSPHLDWIESIVGPAGLGGGSDGSSLTLGAPQSVPEAGSLAFGAGLGLIAAVVAVRRFRSRAGALPKHATGRFGPG